ncbi:MAG: hypothetical protein U1D00_10750, partial [Mycobacterium sp.]|nr:hypothetical protein [Mycobacterium sp.]
MSRTKKGIVVVMLGSAGMFLSAPLLSPVATADPTRGGVPCVGILQQIVSTPADSPQSLQRAASSFTGGPGQPAPPVVVPPASSSSAGTPPVPPRPPASVSRSSSGATPPVPPSPAVPAASSTGAGTPPVPPRPPASVSIPSSGAT